MRKSYIAVFLLPKPNIEHKGIVEVIRSVSGGDFKAAFVGTGTVGYVFTSEKLPWQIKFPRIIMNDDSYFIVEIGNDFSQQNLGAVENWMKSRRLNK